MRKVELSSHGLTIEIESADFDSLAEHLAI
jgi:hypothetical protein